jgi:hypothetical protein
MEFSFHELAADIDWECPRAILYGLWVNEFEGNLCDRLHSYIPRRHSQFLSSDEKLQYDDAYEMPKRRIYRTNGTYDHVVLDEFSLKKIIK